MKQLFLIPLVIIGMQVAGMAQDRYGADRARFGDVVPPGTQIQVRTNGPITVARWDRGRIFAAHVDRDVFARDGDMVIPRGAYCELTVREIGPGQMTLDLESITANGRRYVLDTAGPQFNMDQGAYQNGTGLVGNIINAITGNGNVEYHGDRIRVPAGSQITFQLQAPLHVVNWRDPGYMNNGEHYHHREDWYR
jgi:hypothetical protein